MVATDPRRGLEAAEAQARLAAVGANELPPPRPEPLWGRLLRALREPMTLLLVVAAGVAGIGLGERLDALAILAIVALNTVIELVEEGRAGRALAALRTLETPTATVRRAGTAVVVPAREVVPGDVVLLAAGDRVPADLLLTEAATLELDESLLTGESLPVAKQPGPAGESQADQDAGRVFAGTLVTRGTAAGLAEATGPSTRLGRIAAELDVPPPATPLQRELAHLTARLGLVAVAIAAAVFALTLLRLGGGAHGLEQAFLGAVALAVAAVPEGLATVVAVALALGVRRMADRGAIVRRLPAVETLGSTTVIATDKTGTLTENRLRLELVALPGRPAVRPAELDPAVAGRVARVAVLCNDLAAGQPGGDPVDRALLAAFDPAEVAALHTRHPRVAAIPFDAERRRMTTLHRDGDGFLLLVKGAPEVLLERAGRVLTTAAASSAGAAVPLGRDEAAALLGRVAELAGRGVRVLALAERALATAPAELAAAERDLVLVGLVGLRDPIRPAAPGAVAAAHAAGIELVMVTGDHAGTAAAIAAEVGLLDGDRPVLDGARVAAEGLPADPARAAVYARVDPAQKLALVEALQAGGHVVAVTGDGVNDAPALRRADIGVALGRAGSDVAREAADMVITDDDLATVLVAVREGRGIYDNIRKVVDYLIAGNLSEITVVVAALLLAPALGVPLLPLQLLWLNLLTDGMPAVALAVDPVDPALMARPPRPRGERLLGLGRLAVLGRRAVLIAAAAVAGLLVARAWGQPWGQARTVMFTVLVTAHLLYAFVARGPDPVRRGRRPAGPPAAARQGNRWLAAAVAAGVALQVAIVAWPPLRAVFDTDALGARDWLLAAGLGLAPVVAILASERRGSAGGRGGKGTGRAPAG